MVGEGNEDDRFDLVVEQYPEEFLPSETLGCLFSTSPHSTRASPPFPFRAVC